MLPVTIFNSMYDTWLVDGAASNVHTAFSPNVDLYYSVSELNPNFSIIPVILSVIFIFVLEVAFATFAYYRGKQLLVKEHLRDPSEYQTDENG